MKQRFDKRELINLLLLLLVVLLSRIPFLGDGYGVEEDSWGIVNSVRHTLESGVYEESRLPGHPVHEAFFLLAPDAGPWFYNGISALMSVVCTLFFALSLRKVGIRNYILPAFAFSFVPIIFVSSTYTIDFTTSLAFILISFYLVLLQRPFAAGILLGLAVGCRITSLAMLLPFFIVQSGMAPLRESYQSLVKLTISTLFISILSYIPVFAIHGPGFFTFSDQFAYPPLTKVIYKATIGVFGLIGFVSILFFKGLILKNKLRTNGILERDSAFNKRLLIACSVACIIFIISYLRLPQKSGYLVPIIPFVIIAFAFFLDEKKFRMLCFLLILSSFFFSVNLTDDKRGSSYSAAAIKLKISGQEIFIDPLTGPVYSDHSKRLQKMIYTNEVIHACEEKKNDFTLICGWWYNEILVTLKENGKWKLHEHFVFYIDKGKIDDALSDDKEVYYLPEQDIYNDAYSNMDGTATLAKPFTIQ